MSAASFLPLPVASLLKGIEVKDADIFANSFDQNAVLEGEATTYNGRLAIKGFGADALIAHNTTLAVQKVTQDGEKFLLEVIMDGEFQESHGITEPFTLYMEFNIPTSSSTIHSLTITDLNPQAPSMLALWAPKPHPTDPLSVLCFGPRLLPTPPTGWVLVKMAAASLNRHDLFTLQGIARKPLTFPRILGCDGCGVLPDGTEVVLYPVMADPTAFGGGDITLNPSRHVLSEETDGTLAQYVVVPEQNAVPRPKNLSLIQAAAGLGIAWLTAYRMLFVRSGLRVGQIMLVQGCAGGVATALIQMGSTAGMRVWATGQSAEKRELAKSLGAEKTFAPGEEVPECVDAVFELAGEATWAHSMRSIRSGGVVVVSGVHSGVTVPFNIRRLLVEQIEVKGVYAGTLDEFRDLVSFVGAKRIVPYVGQVFPIDRAKEGLKNLWEGKTMGKIVLTF